MKEKQFNGYNWCPFLFEINNQNQSKHVSLENYNNYLEIFRNPNKKIIFVTKPQNLKKAAFRLSRPENRPRN